MTSTDPEQASVESRMLIQPGWHNSGPEHWQSHWQRALGSQAVRVEQQDWDLPDCRAWVSALGQAAGSAPSKAVILAHSIGSIAVVHLLNSAMEHAGAGNVAAAVLVSPADAEREDAAAALLSFAPIPMQPLPVPVLLIASTNDPYCSEARAREMAQAWRADLELVQGGGHINTEAGFGPWPEGWKLVGEWLARHGLVLEKEKDHA